VAGGVAVLALTMTLAVGNWLAAASGVVIGAGGVAGGLLLRRAWNRPQAVPALQHQEEFARTLQLIVGLDELLGNCVSRIGQWLEAERVAVLATDPVGTGYTVRANLGYTPAELAEVALPESARLVRWLYTNETHLVPANSPEVVAYLEPEERNLLERLQVSVVLPLVAANHLAGLILLSGPGQPAADRLASVWALIPPLSLALENASLSEQQRLRLRRLYRAERLATIGQLAAGAAHEIRNPLASIRSTIQYLSRALPKDGEAIGLVTDLIAETDRINTIVEGMLAFARPAVPRLAQVDLVEVLGQTLRLIEPMARKSRVTTQTLFPAPGATLHADPDQLKQVFLNVMMNGVQAMPEGGTLTASVAALGPSRAGPAWRVEIADTGTGIPPADLERVFDPFFTTKPDGTGLGLSICHAIVEGHGGQMELQSVVGQGTTVRIWL
jgi:signal transduction histidine kinase